MIDNSSLPAESRSLYSYGFVFATVSMSRYRVFLSPCRESCHTSIIEAMNFPPPGLRQDPRLPAALPPTGPWNVSKKGLRYLPAKWTSGCLRSLKPIRLAPRQKQLSRSQQAMCYDPTSHEAWSKLLFLRTVYADTHYQRLDRASWKHERGSLSAEQASNFHSSLKLRKLLFARLEKLGKCFAGYNTWNFLKSSHRGQDMDDPAAIAMFFAATACPKKSEEEVVIID